MVINMRQARHQQRTPTASFRLLVVFSRLAIRCHTAVVARTPLLIGCIHSQASPTEGDSITQGLSFWRRLPFERDAFNRGTCAVCPVVQ